MSVLLGFFVGGYFSEFLNSEFRNSPTRDNCEAKNKGDRRKYIFKEITFLVSSQDTLYPLLVERPESSK
jgi:hypothetical protein